jgi:hypothetical protein
MNNMVGGGGNLGLYLAYRFMSVTKELVRILYGDKS